MIQWLVFRYVFTDYRLCLGACFIPLKAGGFNHQRHCHNAFSFRGAHLDGGHTSLRKGILMRET